MKYLDVLQNYCKSEILYFCFTDTTLLNLGPSRYVGLQFPSFFTSMAIIWYGDYIKGTFQHIWLAQLREQNSEMTARPWLKILSCSCLHVGDVAAASSSLTKCHSSQRISNLQEAECQGRQETAEGSWEPQWLCSRKVRIQALT